MKLQRGALVLLSGGQDSTTCLAWAISEYARVEAVTFLYGQRHAREAEAARVISERLRARHRVIDLAGMGEALGGALTGQGDLSGEHPTMGAGAIAANVPNRNFVLLALAHSLAQRLGLGTIVLGSTKADCDHFPDCRPDFLGQAERLLNLSSGGTGIILALPFMELDKAAVFRMAERLGVLQIILRDTLTCYEGQWWTEFEWGRGCGECPACRARAAGWADFKAGR